MDFVRFFGGIYLTLKEFCQQINGEIFAFWHFSVTYNISFTKIICISLPHRLKDLVFFLHFSGNSVFLHLKKYQKHQANCNILLPVCFKHPILQII